MATLIHTALVIATVLIGLAGIGMSAGGLGTLHKECQDLANVDDELCDEEFRSEWWAIIFGTGSLILAVVSSIMGRVSNPRWLLLVVAFVAMSTVDLMDATEKSLVWRDERSGLAGPLEGDLLQVVTQEDDAVKVLTAGLICMSAASWLVIIVATVVAPEEEPAKKDIEGAAAPLA
ncbi:unnamed protein product [Ostreobium quekettii]|uniref:Uncharacterized protein n=1 Tax=Ostreobium quekettii TaxID=121088 RepID=A0A8S1J0K0_9CHLO|nr:unnamed protein product [Ostreobium quekettii]|eukprot:evm.model.scf_2170.2 EVM.evm.TU.scf_2170.2   scf_2170:11252-11779(+)